MSGSRFFIPATFLRYHKRPLLFSILLLKLSSEACTSIGLASSPSTALFWQFRAYYENLISVRTFADLSILRHNSGQHIAHHTRFSLIENIWVTALYLHFSISSHALSKRFHIYFSVISIIWIVWICLCTILHSFSRCERPNCNNTRQSLNVNSHLGHYLMFNAFFHLIVLSYASYTSCLKP